MPSETHLKEKDLVIRKPCEDCPFRNDDKAVHLTQGRKEQIIEDLLSGTSSTFHCHKTVYKNGTAQRATEGESTLGIHRACAGAAAVARKCGRDTQMIQIAERLGIINSDYLDKIADKTTDPKDLNINYEKSRTYRPPKTS